MTTLEFLKDSKEMILHNLWVYGDNPQYEKEYLTEKEKLAIVENLIKREENEEE